MDFFNDLFGSEMDQLKSRTKVILPPLHEFKRNFRQKKK